MAPKQDSETVAVNVQELRNSKDAVIMRLMALQSYIADLSKAYVEHANNVINGGPATIDFPAMPTGLSSHLDLALRGTSPGAKSEAGGPKKRKRAPADPNAPKRALTPYFLFMQSNRARIAQDLGDNAKPMEVANEGTRRWQAMEPKEKEVWKQLYQDNYEVYKAKMAAYKAGRNPEEEDPAASQLQQDFAGAEKESEESSSDESSSSEEESPSPQPKEKTPPRSSSSKRRKSDAKEESPVKKGKGKNAEPASMSKEKAPGSAKRKGKKRKSEA